MADKPKSRKRTIIKRLLTLAFFITVVFLIYGKAREIQWNEVVEALRGYQTHTLLIGLGLSGVAYGIYSLFDILSKKQTGHSVSTGNTLLIAFVCYAFNLNLGALVGGFAFRFRLYSRYGMKPGVISRVIGFSILSNWTGYVILTGFTLAFQFISFPESWAVNQTLLRFAGIIMLLASAGYFGACILSSRRQFKVRDTEFELPSAKMAMAQAFISCSSWLTIASILYVLLGQSIPFVIVLGAFLVSGLAAVIAHIPGGLGILEGVMVALLSTWQPSAQILAAVFAFRTVYYLIPLAVAFALYVAMELKARHRLKSQPTSTAPTTSKNETRATGPISPSPMS